MFKVSGIIGISKIGIFDFWALKGLITKECFPPNVFFLTQFPPFFLTKKIKSVLFRVVKGKLNTWD